MTLLTLRTCTMHSPCMSTKTISLRLEAYEKLRAARRYPDESFSQVVLRARWPEETVTAAELLQLCDERGASFTDDELDRVEELKEDDVTAEDKWQRR
jgi:predicted CopG family antitoxin